MASGAPTIGLVLPAREAAIRGDWDLRGLVDVARRAEALGFTGVWTGDSLSRPRPEPLALLAAVAHATSDVAIGTAALLGGLREPVVTAATLATIDRISDGRLVVAVGGGFPGPDTDAEHAAIGLDPADRMSRLDRHVATWRRCWSPGAFPDRPDLPDLPDLPPPVQPGGPPVWLAAGPGATARVARHYDGWLPYPPDPADYDAGLRRIVDRAPDRAVARACYVTVLVDDDPERATVRLDAYTEAYYGLPLEIVGVVQAFVAGTATDVRAGLQRYLDAGAHEMVVRIGTLDLGDDRDDLDRTADALVGGWR
jgi:alkanesulfonate monooxygenase SsuD/methylene tetrahydromethanopterin reductase-like flavin-dependent oxidoreductase (luciferase family)